MVQFQVDANGQRLTTRTPLGFVTAPTWNDRNLLAPVQTPASGPTRLPPQAQTRTAQAGGGCDRKTARWVRKPAIVGR